MAFNREGVQYGSGVTGVDPATAANIAMQSAQDRGNSGGSDRGDYFRPLPQAFAAAASPKGFRNAAIGLVLLFAVAAFAAGLGQPMTLSF